MKIVIISHLIYPFNSPRSNRATELAKEFARLGHEVFLYGLLGNYNYRKFESENNLKIKDLGPTLWTSLKSDGPERLTFTYKVLYKLFHKALEFPHIDLAFRTSSILKKESNIDLLITVAYPYPIHWGAALRKMKEKKHFAKVWIADCGDPYMGNPIEKHPFYFGFVEKFFCKKADYITIPNKEGIEGYYSEFHNKIKIIPQGFEFKKITPKRQKSDNLQFIYAGRFYLNYRDPRPLLDYLKTRSDVDFQFIIYTNSQRIIESYKEILGKKLIIRNYINREELLAEMAGVDFLVNLENKSSIQSPSKLIDYVLSNRPILSIDTAKGLEIEKIDQFLHRNYESSLKIEDIAQYNIKNVVQKFINLTSTQSHV